MGSSDNAPCYQGKIQDCRVREYLYNALLYLYSSGGWVDTTQDTHYLAATLQYYIEILYLHIPAFSPFLVRSILSLCLFSTFTQRSSVSSVMFPVIHLI